MAVTKKEAKAQDKTKLKEFILDNNIKTLWVDEIQLALREDDMCLVRFSAHLPEGHYEQCRIMLAKKNFEQLLEVASKVLNYYPSPKQEESTEIPE